MQPLTTKSIKELTNSLHNYASSIRTQGALDKNAGLVTIELVDHDHLKGSVGNAPSEKTQLIYSHDGAWISQCTCGKEYQCRHSYALGLAVLELQPKESIPIEYQVRILLNRTLTAKEHAYLKRIKTAWTEYNRTHIVSDKILSLLGNQNNYYRRWNHLNEFEGYWANPPISALELVGYATVYQELNDLEVPPLAAKITDTNHYHQLVSENMRQNAIATWKETLESNANTATVLINSEQSVEIVIVLNNSRWEFQCLHSDGKYTKANSTLINSLIYEEKDTLSNQAIAFISLGEEFFQQWHGKSTSSQSRQARNFLYKLLKHPQMRTSVVDKNYTPIAYNKEALVWKTTKIQREENNVALLELTMPNGEAIPPNAICLKVADLDDYDDDGASQAQPSPSIYLINNAAFQGPDLLAGKSNIEIPWESIASEQGIAFLKAQKSPIPSEFEDNIETIDPILQLRCELSEVPSFYGRTSCVSCELLALNPELAPLYEYTDQGWKTTHHIGSSKPTSAPIQIIDRKKIDIPRSTFATPFINWDPYKAVWNYPLKDASQYDAFATWVQQLPPNIEVQLPQELAGLDAPAVSISYEIDTQESESVDWFDVKLVQKVNDALLTKAEIKLLLAAPGKLVKLPSGQWRRADLQQTPETERLTKELGLKSSKESQRLHTLQLQNDRTADALSEASKAKVAQRIAQLGKARKASPPKAFKDILRPYQKEGFEYLSFLSNLGLGGILADDMGLGKTIQALAWLSWLKTKSKKQSKFRVLIVCPKSVMDNWTHETEKFNTKLSSSLYNPREHSSLPAVNILVTNYTQLRINEETLVAQNWDAAILDEGQYIKSPSSQTARAACNLKADKRLVLTGTPIENRALDLWSLMRFAMPGMLGSQASFTRVYNDKKDPEALPRLARRIKPFVLRRTKGQVAKDLPERIEEELHCELDGEQATLYKAELKKAQQGLLAIKTKQQFDKGRFNILQSLMRLRQICCDPRLLGAKMKKNFVSAKIQGLLDIIEPLQEEGHKILVFSQFVSMLELLQKTLDARSIPYLTLTGKTQNRKELITRFQETDTEKVFLLSLKAAGSGLNLTKASYVALFDPWWNPAVEAQAIDRTHRIGQTRQVIAYRLIAKNTIEEKIRELQKKKSDLANAVIDEKTLNNVLSLDDIKFILAEPSS